MAHAMPEPKPDSASGSNGSSAVAGDAAAYSNMDEKDKAVVAILGGETANSAGDGAAVSVVVSGGSGDRTTSSEREGHAKVGALTLSILIKSMTAGVVSGFTLAQLDDSAAPVQFGAVVAVALTVLQSLGVGLEGAFLTVNDGDDALVIAAKTTARKLIIAAVQIGITPLFMSVPEAVLPPAIRDVTGVKTNLDIRYPFLGFVLPMKTGAAITFSLLHKFLKHLYKDIDHYIGSEGFFEGMLAGGVEIGAILGYSHGFLPTALPVADAFSAAVGTVLALTALQSLSASGSATGVVVESVGSAVLAVGNGASKVGGAIASGAYATGSAFLSCASSTASLAGSCCGRIAALFHRDRDLGIADDGPLLRDAVNNAGGAAADAVDKGMPRGDDGAHISMSPMTTGAGVS